MLNKNFLFLSVTIIGALICTWSLSAQAGEPRLLQTYGAWDAYAFEEGGGKVCYMSSQPVKDQGNYKNRDDIHALITHRPSEGTMNVFTYMAGYSYKPASDATLEIDGQKFILFTKDGTAWAFKPETDQQIAQALRSGKSMMVRGTSSRGNTTKDTYSLDGSSAAYERITKECN